MDAEAPLGTLVAGGGKHAVVGAWLAQHNLGNVGNDARDAISTLTTTGSQQQVAGAYLVHQRGTSTALDARDAAPALTTGGGKGGDHVGVAAAFLHHQYSTGGQHQGLETPLATQSTRDRTALTTAAMDAPPMAPEQLARARQVADFLRAHGVWDGGDVVTVGPWVVVDIGMRMLRPSEAAAAHELRMPDEITIAKRDRKGGVVIDQDGRVVHVRRPLTKTEAMRLIGNSVPKRMAMLLSALNAPRVLAVAAE